MTIDVSTLRALAAKATERFELHQDGVIRTLDPQTVLELLDQLAAANERAATAEHLVSELASSTSQLAIDRDTLAVLLQEHREAWNRLHLGLHGGSTPGVDECINTWHKELSALATPLPDALEKYRQTHSGTDVV